MTSDPDETSSETVLDSRESSFGRRSQQVSLSLCRIEGLFGFTSGIVIDDGDVVEGDAVFSDESVVIGGVHDVVETGDSLC